MSVEIWTNIRDAVKEVRPDLTDTFNTCRDRESICKFLELNFPLTEQMITVPSWSVQIMSNVPDIIRKGWRK